MESEILDGTIKQSSKENSPELIKRNENSWEKGSLEYLFQDSFKKQNNEPSIKELQQNFDDKDKSEEKFRSEISISNKDLDIYDEEVTKFSKPTNKNFNFETLNRDLADIEERLRATRLSWNKNGKSSANESNEIGSAQKEIVRKSWSLLDIEKRPYSNGSSFNDLDNCKRLSGEKLVCESPALSEGLLKWDYGADIGLTQDDSDDMDPITWPVTAEQAQKEAHDKNGIGRRMKISLSQGSFLSSPDPEDRQNLIAKISAEYKSNKITNSTKNNNINASTEIISLANGIYDDLSAKQIMEQAEAAEKRLRQRLEAVKALHLNDNLRNTDGSNESPIENCNEIHDSIRSPNYSDSPMSRDACFDRNVSNNEFITGNVKNQQMKLTEGMTSELTKPNFTEDDCKSPTSLSYTGRTTTMESTHTSSDYGKAPLFTGEIYGSRKDSYFHENKFVMYSKHNRDQYIDKTKSADNKDLRNPRLICGIPPELDTISSRETLQITDEKKDDILSSPLVKTINDNVSTTKEMKGPEESPDHLSDKDLSQEHSLQAKWNQFKTMMKDEEYNNLKEKTNIRSAIQYNQIPHINFKSNDHCNTNRQQSTATTFTTITNISPRYDSFATEVFRNPHKEFHNNEYHFGKRKSGQENENKSNSGKMPEEKVTRTGDQKYGSSKYLSCHSRSGKRLASGGGGGGGKDNEDNDDEISQTERRKLRHALELAKFKKRFGSGALDGETTASELEHDDISKFRKNLIVKDNRKKQLSQMLTEISKQGVADDSNQEITDVSESSSVDTLLLMNKMSHLLRKKNSDNTSKRDSRKSTSEKPYKNLLMNSNQKEKSKIHTKKVVESDDAKLILKHLMLKQKVKWLADCAREEARRRKIRKLQKLMDLYEQGNPIIIPDDLETDTATLMGSNRCSQEDLCSQSDLCSMYENEASNIVVPTSPDVDNKNFRSNKRHKTRSKSPPVRKISGEKSSMPRKENFNKNHKKVYPMSEAWHIPLRDSDYQIQSRDFNDSNEYNCESPMSNENNGNYYRSSRNPIQEYSSRPANLTAKERFQLRRDLELARQRNANECQKDLRHTKTGNTKVTTGGLSWTFGANNMESNCTVQYNSKEGDRKSNMCRGENVKDDNYLKSELQLAFENKMENFISKSRQRQKRIKLAVEERRYESQMNLERSRLFVTNNECQGLKKRRPVTQPDPLSDRKIKVSPKQVKKNHISRSSSLNGNKSPISERLYKPRRRFFSKSEMRVQSAKKYQALPEVQAKYLDERRKARIQNNRMKMHLYGERILQSLLRNRGPWISNEN